MRQFIGQSNSIRTKLILKKDRDRDRVIQLTQIVDFFIVFWSLRLDVIVPHLAQRISYKAERHSLPFPHMPRSLFCHRAVSYIILKPFKGLFILK